MAGAKDKLGLRVHGLIVGSPEKKRADPAVLRQLCAHTLPNGKNEARALLLGLPLHAWPHRLHVPWEARQAFGRGLSPGISSQEGASCMSAARLNDLHVRGTGQQYLSKLGLKEKSPSLMPS